MTEVTHEGRYNIFQYVLASAGGMVFAGALSDPAFANDYQYQSFNRTPNVIPSVPELMQLRRRGKIDDDDFYASMRSNGIKQSLADVLYELTKYVPTPPEMAEWARREAFQEQYQEMFGGDLEYPKQMDTLAKIIGADYDPFGDQPNMMRYFWRAHWQIPGVGQAFEMFHRGVISEEELQNLFIAADIMPGWRDKLLQISYNLPTRVDVRRMFRVGTINADEVYDFYQKIGYTDENAARLTEFTVITEGEEFTNITRAQIVNAFEEGVFSEAEALEYLQAIGYHEGDATFYINMAIIDVENAKEKELIKIYTDNFSRGIDSQEIFISNLNSMDLPATQSEQILNSAVAKKEKSKIRPTRTTIDKWYKLGVIDEAEVRVRYGDLSYTDEDIELFVTELTQIPEGGITLPTKTDMLDWYVGEYINEIDLRMYMRAAGYPVWAVDLYIRQADDSKQEVA